MNKIFDELYTECFGSYNADNILCKKYCAKSLACIIEHDQNTDTDFLEALLMHDKTFMIIK